MFDRRIEMYIVDCSYVQFIYLSDGLYMLSMGILCKYGVCKSSRGILGFYPCHLYYIADCGDCGYQHKVRYSV